MEKPKALLELRYKCISLSKPLFPSSSIREVKEGFEVWK